MSVTCEYQLRKVIAVFMQFLLFFTRKGNWLIIIRFCFLAIAHWISWNISLWMSMNQLNVQLRKLRSGLPPTYRVIVVVVTPLCLAHQAITWWLNLCFCSTPIKLWVRGHMWFYILAYVTFFITYIVLACCPSVRRKFPGNYIALGVFVSTHGNHL